MDNSWNTLTNASRVVNSNYVTQNTTAEDLLKSETVGLVKLDDFRKRRVEVLERKERERREGSGRGTPSAERSRTPAGDSISSVHPAKKKRIAVTRGKLSFGIEDEDDITLSSALISTAEILSTTVPLHGAVADGNLTDKSVVTRIGPNAGIQNLPKVMTKSTLAKEAQVRDELRKTFLETQEVVKSTEFLLPFVFYDGTNIPGGACRVRKGDHVWLFLDKARKLGAELGVGGGDKSRKEWARVGVDDLMLVRGEIIIPHHYDFYYFIAGKVLGFGGPIFNLSAKPTATSPASTSIAEALRPFDYDSLIKAVKRKDKVGHASVLELEGYGDDPNTTKVVDRRWYEKNKHIFPASVWEEFDPSKDYTKGIRKDLEGNSFFFS